MVRHPHGILPRGILRGRTSSDGETNKNEQGMLQHTISPFGSRFPQNNRSKFNVALGIDAQGFCMIKAHQAPGS
jgi:hypothetical protein